MDPNLIFNTVNGVLEDFLAANQSMFVAMGSRMFRSLATIMVAWYGMQTALAPTSANLARFARLVLLVSFGFTITVFYADPIPGVGYSFSGLIAAQATFMSQEIGSATAGRVTSGVATALQNLGSPSITNFLEVINYYTISLMLVAVQAVTFVVIGFGYIVQAVCIIIGPVFVPFFIVPKLDWLFWSWLRCLLIYSFYQVVANCFVYIFGNILLSLLANEAGLLSGKVEPVEWMTTAPVLYIFLFIFLFGILKIPTVTNHIFSGSGGESGGFAQAATSTASVGAKAAML